MTDRREQDERETPPHWVYALAQPEHDGTAAAGITGMAGGFPENRQAFDDMALLWREMSALPRLEITEQHPPAFPLLRPLRHTLAGLFILVMLFLPYSQLPALLMDNLTLATAAESKSMILPDGSRIFPAVTAKRILPMNRHTAAFPGARYRLFQVKSNPWRLFWSSVRTAER